MGYSIAELRRAGSAVNVVTTLRDFKKAGGNKLLVPMTGCLVAVGLALALGIIILISSKVYATFGIPQPKEDPPWLRALLMSMVPLWIGITWWLLTSDGRSSRKALAALPPELLAAVEAAVRDLQEHQPDVEVPYYKKEKCRARLRDDGVAVLLNPHGKVYFAGRTDVQVDGTRVLIQIAAPSERAAAEEAAAHEGEDEAESGQSNATGAEGNADDEAPAADDELAPLKGKVSAETAKRLKEWAAAGAA
jgi:hypothetical protein